MMFLFKQVIFRFQALIFQGVYIYIYVNIYIYVWKKKYIYIYYIYVYICLRATFCCAPCLFMHLPFLQHSHGFTHNLLKGVEIDAKALNLLVMEKIRRSPVDMVSSSHYLQGFIDQVKPRISEPSTVPMIISIRIT